MAREAIFIAYRRDDTADVAGRIFDALEQRFGRDCLFKDVDNLRPGADFGEYINTILPRCRVALILIGPNWVNAQDEDGRRRLDDPHDWVRIEIEIALAAGDLNVVPVLINGAPMPRAEELPPSLHPLLRRHAATIRRDPDFRDDVERLATTLRARLHAGSLDLGALERTSSPDSAQAPHQANRMPSLLLIGGAAVAVALVIVAVGFNVPRWMSPQHVEPEAEQTTTPERAPQDALELEGQSQRPLTYRPVADALVALPNVEFTRIEPRELGVYSASELTLAVEPLMWGTPDDIFLSVQEFGDVAVVDIVRRTEDVSLSAGHVRIRFERASDGWRPTNSYRRSLCARGEMEGQWTAGVCP